MDNVQNGSESETLVVPGMFVKKNKPKANKTPKLKKDGTPRKPRHVVSDEVFLDAFNSVVQSGGSLGDIAQKTGLEYGSVIQRINSINEVLESAGQPLLPDLARKTGPRKNVSNLLALVAAKIGKGTKESLDVSAPISGEAPEMSEAEKNSEV